MRYFLPVFLFLGLVVGGLVLQREASARRKALEDSLGGPRVGISLEMSAAFHRQIEGPGVLTGPFAAAAGPAQEAPFGPRTAGLFGEAVGTTEGELEWEWDETSEGLVPDAGSSEAALLGGRR